MDSRKGGDLAISEFWKGSSSCRVNGPGSSVYGRGDQSPGRDEAGGMAWMKEHLGAQVLLTQRGSWGYSQGSYRAGDPALAGPPRGIRWSDAS